MGETAVETFVCFISGIVMMIGSTVYVAAGSDKELHYRPQDLHAGWGLCASCGVACILLCSTCMYKYVKSRRRTFSRGYIPINDLDDQLIEV